MENNQPEGHQFRQPQGANEQMEFIEDRERIEGEMQTERERHAMEIERLRQQRRQFLEEGENDSEEEDEERARERVDAHVEPLEEQEGRGRFFSEAPEVNLARCVGQWVVQHVGEYPKREPYHPVDDALGLSFECPGGDEGRRCTVSTATLGSLFPNSPSSLHTLQISSLRDMAKAATIVLGTHRTQSAVLAALIDPEEGSIVLKGLMAGLAAFKTRCFHSCVALQVNLRDPLMRVNEHLPLSSTDPFEWDTMRRQAVRGVQRAPEGSSLLEESLKTLVIVPKAFGAFSREYEFQRTVICPVESTEECEEITDFSQYGAMVLMTPTSYTNVSGRRGLYGLALRAMRVGLEVYLMAGPRDDVDWAKNVDQMGDFYDEVLQRVPEFGSRLRCLLPNQFNIGETDAPWTVPAHPQVNVRPLLLSANWCKKFWRVSLEFYRSHIPLENPRRKNFGGEPRQEGDAGGPRGGLAPRGGNGERVGHANRGRVARPVVQPRGHQGSRGIARGGLAPRGGRGRPGQAGGFRGRGGQYNHRGFRGNPCRGHGQARPYGGQNRGRGPARPYGGYRGGYHNY